MLQKYYITGITFSLFKKNEIELKIMLVMNTIVGLLTNNQFIMTIV